MDVKQNSQKFEFWGTGVHNSQKIGNTVPVPRVLWHGSYRTHRRSGYGYESPTELTEVPGTGMKVLQNFQNFRVLWHGRTELTDVPGRYVRTDGTKYERATHGTHHAQHSKRERCGDN